MAAAVAYFVLTAICLPLTPIGAELSRPFPESDVLMHPESLPLRANTTVPVNTSTTAADPGAGKIRLNSGTQNSATAAYVDQTDDDGNSIESTLQTIDSVSSAVKGHIRISNRTDATQFLTFAISDLTDNGDWWTLNITNELCLVSNSNGLIFENK